MSYINVVRRGNIHEQISEKKKQIAIHSAKVLPPCLCIFSWATAMNCDFVQFKFQFKFLNVALVSVRYVPSRVECRQNGFAHKIRKKTSLLIW